jgi:hypothetical protein
MPRSTRSCASASPITDASMRPPVTACATPNDRSGAPGAHDVGAVVYHRQRHAGPERTLEGASCVSSA